MSQDINFKMENMSRLLLQYMMGQANLELENLEDQFYIQCEL